MFDLTERSIRDRAERLSLLRQRHHVPVLIVGGGINGISTFRELALQGIPAILVEKDDWCQAASGALSRMIHGGLRYLETGEFSLVKEAVIERDRLLKNAPHYVFPLRTTVPIDNWGGGVLNAAKRFFRLSETPTRRGAMLIECGLRLYDLYTARHGTMPKHALHDETATRQRWPGFADWVKYSATYYDAWISAPERLGVELIDDSERARPAALAINYMQVSASAGGGVTLRDALSGEQFTLHPHVVVNATGAWIDQLNHTLAHHANDRRLIGGTKGSHLILDAPALLAELNGEMVYFENQEGRICIMFPWLGRVLVGTTDIRVDDPEEAVCEASEKAYILDSLRFVFSRLSIHDSDVLYTFCGVRPLPTSEAEDNGKISRNHSLVLLPPDSERDFCTLCLVGGKWTTFRRFGEQAADRVLRLLGETRTVSTADLAIGGGRNFPGPERVNSWLATLSSESGLPVARVKQLFSRYGTRALPMISSLCRSEDRPLQHHPDYSENELRYLILHEQVAKLEDVLVRRTALAITGALTPALVEEISRLCADTLGWSEAQRQQQIQETGTRLARLHGLTGLLSYGD